jgi:hypothetical protein
MFWGVAGVAGGIAGIGVLAWAGWNGHADRDAEDAARDYYQEHGHWPDEAA